MTTYTSRQLAGHAGEHLAASVIASDLRWIYRHQPVADIGIDGEIEILGDDGKSTANLIKVQIKATNVAAVPRVEDVDPEHFAYWQMFPVPVIVCHVDIPRRKIHWWPSSAGRLATAKYHYDAATARPMSAAARSELLELVDRERLPIADGLVALIEKAALYLESIEPNEFADSNKSDTTDIIAETFHAERLIEFIVRFGLAQTPPSDVLDEYRRRLAAVQVRLERVTDNVLATEDADEESA